LIRHSCAAVACLRASDLSTWRDAFLDDPRHVAAAASVTHKAVKLAYTVA